VVPLEDGCLDYSDYLGQLSNLNRIGALFAGFDFTVVTLLLTQLDDPSRPRAQLVLYAMYVLLLALIYWVGWTGMLHVYLCRRVPPNSPRLKGFAVSSFALYVFICVPLVLMFFLWGLPILGGGALMTWTAFVAASVVYIWKPLKNFKQTRDYYHGIR
jgi:hypothetical protein